MQTVLFFGGDSLNMKLCVAIRSLNQREVDIYIYIGLTYNKKIRKLFRPNIPMIELVTDG